MTLRTLRTNRLFVSVAMITALFAFSSTKAEAQSAPKGAGNMTLEAIINQNGSYSSNPLLLTHDASSLWGETTSPELVFRRETPRSNLMFDARLDESLFDESSFNTTDVHASTDVSTHNQRWSVGFMGGTNYDTTRTSELTNYGLHAKATRHLGLSAAPRISYSPTTSDAINLQTAYARSDYDGDNFTNYETITVSPSYTHQFDQRNTGIFSLSAQRYQTTDNNANQVDSIGPSLGWETVLSERLTANVGIGTEASRQFLYGYAVGPWEWDLTFNGGLLFEGEQDKVNLTASRSQSPYGNGTQSLQTTFAVDESHKLNPRVSLNAGVKYLTASYQSSTAGNIDQLTDVHTGVAYHLTDDFDLSANYRFRYETLVGRSNDAQDHAVTVGLAYRPSKWTLSR